MNDILKRTAIVLTLTLMLLSMAGCGGGKNAQTSTAAAEGTNAPQTPSGTVQANPTVPNAVEGVEDWTSTGTQIPSTQPGNQQTGNQQTGNQTGNEQNGNQNGDSQTGNQEKPAQPGTLTLEAYRAMSTSEQQAYFQSFETVEAFYEWLEAAEKDYEDRHKNDSVTGDGTLDLGDYVGKN